MFYTKFPLPWPIFYWPSLKCTHIGEWASVSFLHWYLWLDLVIIGLYNGLVPNTSKLMVSSHNHTARNRFESKIEMNQFSLTKLHLKLLSAILVPFCPGGDDLNLRKRHSKDISIAWLIVSKILPLYIPQLNSEGKLWAFFGEIKVSSVLPLTVIVFRTMS